MYFSISIISILLIVIAVIVFGLRQRKKLAIGVGIAITLASFTMYALWSEIPGMLYTGWTATSAEDQSIDDIEEHMNARGSSPENWTMLARLYMEKGKLDDAVRIFAKVESTSDLPASAMIDYAQALFVHQGQMIDSKVNTLIQQALLLEPNNIKALWWSGFSSYSESRYQAAINTWTRLHKLLENDKQSGSDTTLQLTQMINDAKAKLKPNEKRISPPKAVPKDTPKSSDTNQSDAPKISVTVQLADTFANQVAGNETLFVYAKAITGPPMPLAIQRMTANQFPINVMLTNDDSMMPSMNLNTFETVKIVARISKSGQARMQTGDLYGESKAVSSASDSAVNIEINQVAP